MLFRERILEASKFIAGSIRSCCTLRLVVHKTTFQLKFIYRYIDHRDSRRNFPRNGAYLLATGGGIGRKFYPEPVFHDTGLKGPVAIDSSIANMALCFRGAIAWCLPPSAI